MDRELRDFFAQAKAITLPESRIRGVHKNLESHIRDFPVRKGVNAGLTGSMMHSAFTKSAKNVGLSKARLRRGHADLLQFMAHNPVGSFDQGFFARYFALRPLVASFVVVVMACGGTAYAAEGAMPGEVLYSVKIAGEQVRSSLYFSVGSKVRFEVQRAERRLEEIERLASRGKIDSDTYSRVRTAFESHVRRVEELSQDAAGIEAASDLESALAAHEAVVESLKQRRVETKDMLQPIILSIRTKRAEMKARVDARAETTESPLENRQKNVDALRLLIEKESGNLSDDIKAQLEGKLKSAENAIIEAELKLQDVHGLRKLDDADRVRENLQDAKAILRENVLRKQLKLDDTETMRLRQQERLQKRAGTASSSSSASALSSSPSAAIIDQQAVVTIDSQTETVTSVSSSVSVGTESDENDVETDSNVVTDTKTEVNIEAGNTVLIEQN